MIDYLLRMNKSIDLLLVSFIAWYAKPHENHLMIGQEGYSIIYGTNQRGCKD